MAFRLFYHLDNHLIIYFCGIKIRIKTQKKVFDLPKITSSGVTETKRDIPLIVSLTTFPERINIVPKTIKTLLNQTLKPDYIKLWLAIEQFPNKENGLPKELLELKQYGLDIEWCNDIKSYKKLIPALKQYPDAVIITTDDDIYYTENTIETLYNCWLKNPSNIYAHRGLVVKYIEDKGLKKLPFDKQFVSNTKASYFNQLTGFGGVLYPPNCLYKEVLDEDKFKTIIPTHDDVWFWAMSVLNRTKTVIVKGLTESITTIENSQEFGLCKKNNASSSGGSVAEACKKVIAEYPQIIDILKEEKCR